MKSLILFIPLSLLLVISLISCDSGSSDGLVSSSIGNTNIDPLFQVYLNEFLAEADKRGVSINSNRLDTLVIQFGELESTTLGLCTSSNRTNEITISNDITEAQARWVVIHELGHCLLRMNHRDDVLSIMNSALRLSQLENIGREAAFDEFFQEQFYEAY